MKRNYLKIGVLAVILTMTTACGTKKGEESMPLESNLVTTTAPDFEETKEPEVSALNREPSKTPSLPSKHPGDSETKEPLETEHPEETNSSTKTEKPKEEQSADPEEPKETKKSQISETKKPVQTKKPVRTKAPVQEQKPSKTKKPETSKKPVKTKTPANTEKPSATKKPQTQVTVKSLRDSVKQAYGSDYLPNMLIDDQTLSDMFGVDPLWCEEYIGELPMISTHSDTLLIIKAKEDAVQNIESALNQYRSILIEDTMQYPMNRLKIQASKVVTIDSYVCFVLLGKMPEEVEERSDEEIVNYCMEQNEIGIETIKRQLGQSKDMR